MINPSAINFESSILELIPTKPWVELAEFNQGEYDQIKSALVGLKINFHWVIKLDWNESHQIPGSKKLAEAYKPFGEYFLEIYKLCMNVLARKRALLSVKLDYDDPTVWFLQICQNHIDEVIGTIKHPQDKPYQIETGDLKRNYIRAYLQNPRDLEKNINPLKSNPYLTDLILLIDAAIELSKQSKLFKENYFKPFIAAWRKALKAFDTPNFQLQYVENGCLMRKGKGKTSINLTRSHNENRIPLRSKPFKS